ncbi:MAG: hypothetical protein JWN38_557 [Candidatus Saccharibacteria bacterium]|nr:hypothetical protein [Candidatus Saccharibacteria bacterium]
MDPDVAARCPEVLGRTVDLLSRMQAASERPPILGTNFVDSPWFAYHTPENTRGIMSLHGIFQVTHLLTEAEAELPKHQQPPRYDLTKARARLVFHQADDIVPLLSLEHNKLRRLTTPNQPFGGHAQLNYFLGIVDKLTEAAFPKPKSR